MPTTCCPNDECNHSFSVDTSDFETQSEPSGSHTTQTLESGTATCPECGTEFEVEFLYEIENDTDNVLSVESH